MEAFSDLGSRSVSTGKLGLCDLRVQRLALGGGLFPPLLGSQSGAQVFNKATGRLNKRKELVGKKRKSLGGPFALTTLGPAQQHGLGSSLPNPIISFCARELHHTQLCYKTEFYYKQAQVAQNLSVSLSAYFMQPKKNAVSLSHSVATLKFIFICLIVILKKRKKKPTTSIHKRSLNQFLIIEVCHCS